ncbi:unnamed protein product [Prorocentrum cordatum]|uniref:Uncharacterized protein n=1 Tax=Prorocentrum cordatum TaxID=2364126 RepID=A0ABN9Q4U0_9DINO|nr:unnamed protein product [Polarella glacialis]
MAVMSVRRGDGPRESAAKQAAPAAAPRMNVGGGGGGGGGGGRGRGVLWHSLSLLGASWEFPGQTFSRAPMLVAPGRPAARIAAQVKAGARWGATAEAAAAAGRCSRRGWPPPTQLLGGLRGRRGGAGAGGAGGDEDGCEEAGWGAMRRRLPN